MKFWLLLMIIKCELRRLLLIFWRMELRLTILNRDRIKILTVEIQMNIDRGVKNIVLLTKIFLGIIII